MIEIPLNCTIIELFSERALFQATIDDNFRIIGYAKGNKELMIDNNPMLFTE